MEEKAELRSDIGALTKEFLDAINSLSLTLAMSMRTLSKASNVVYAKYDEFIRTNCESSERDGKEVYRLKAYDYSHEHDELLKQLDRIRAGSLKVPRSFLVALISEYDAFLGNLVKALLYLRPELIESSERSLTFSELSSFANIDAA